MVGFGSIGQAAAALALELLGAPRRLVICDLATQLAAQQEALERLRQAGVSDVITVEAGASAAPQQVYGCDLIIGASSQGGLIDVNALRPGTVVIDDSFPPIVDPDAAAERMRVRGDVLVLSGGDLALEGAERQVHVQVPAGAALPPLSGIPGCRAEALILCAGDDLPAVQGLVALEQARAYHTKATALGLRAAPPHVGAHAVDLDALRKTFPTEPA